MRASDQIYFNVIEHRNQINTISFAWIVLIILALAFLLDKGAPVLLSGLELALTWFFSVYMLNVAGDVAVYAHPRLLLVMRSFGRMLVADLLLSISALQGSEIIAGATRYLTTVQHIVLAVSLILLIGRLAMVLYLNRTFQQS